MPESLSSVRIVLVEPAGSLNVGSVARIMKNMGLRHLVLVNPRCDPQSDEARKMAVHAADVLEAALQVQTLPEALQGCRRIIATTGRSDTTLPIPLELPRNALPWLISDTAAPAQSYSPPTEIPSLHSSTPPPLHPSTALVFGREDRGLTNEELNYAQRLICIPASPDYTSLNLAQAVAICCYELYLAVSDPPTAAASNGVPRSQPDRSVGGTPSHGNPADPPTFETLEAYYQQLEALLLRIGYLYPHTARSRMEKFRRLLHRAYPSSDEVAMLRGILRQAIWALEQTTPSDPPS